MGWLPVKFEGIAENNIRLLSFSIDKMTDIKKQTDKLNNNRYVITGIIATGAAVAINYFISFFLTPYLSDMLGIEVYGYISISKTLVSYAQIFTIALTSFIVRYVSVAYHERNYEEANGYYTSSIVASVLFSVIICIISGLLILKLECILVIEERILTSVKILFFIVFIDLGVKTITTPFGTSAYIKGRLDLTGLIKILAYITDASVIIFLFSFGETKLYYVGIGALIASCVTLFLSGVMTKKLTPELIFNKSLVSYNKVKTLVGNGIWNSINTLGNVLNSGLDLIVSNLMLTAVETGQIAVVKTIGSMFQMLYDVVYQPFQPKLIKAYADSDINVFVNEQKKTMKVCGCFSNIALAGFVALGGLYYKLWLPNQDWRILTGLTIVTVLIALTEGIMRPIYYVYTLTVSMKVPCVITIIGGLINIASMYFLISFTSLRAYAVVGTTTVIMFLVNIFLNPMYAARKLGIKAMVYYRIMLRHFASAACMIVTFRYVAKAIEPHSWLGLILSGMVMACVGAGIHTLIMQPTKTLVSVLTQVLKKNR